MNLLQLYKIIFSATTILIIFLSPASTLATQTLTIYTEYTDSTNKTYTTTSTDLVNWIHQQNYTGVKNTQYYSGNGETAIQHFEKNNATLKGKCTILPVIVIGDKVIYGFTEANKAEISKAMQPAPTTTPPATTTNPPSTTTAPSNTTTSATPDSDNSIKNPLENMSLNVPKDGDLLHMVGPLLMRIINLIITLAGVVSVLMIIISGYNMVTSGGNQESIKKGQNGLTYAIMGLAITLLSGFIMWSIQSTLGLTM